MTGRHARRNTVLTHLDTAARTVRHLLTGAVAVGQSVITGVPAAQTVTGKAAIPRHAAPDEAPDFDVEA